MSKLEWDKNGERHLEFGVSNGVLYTEYMNGSREHQNLDEIMCTAGTGMEFFYPAYTIYSDSGPGLHDPTLADKNLYTSDFFYNKLNWSTFTRYHHGWTDGKAINGTGEIIDSEGKAASDLMPTDTYFQSTATTLRIWTATDWSYPMEVHFYNFQNVGTYTYTGHVTIAKHDPNGAVVNVPTGSLPYYRIRLVMPKSDSGTIDSLFIIDETEPGSGKEDMEAWKEECAFDYGDEDLDTPISPNDYTIGGTIYTGVVWNGLTAVTESPEGAEPNDLYADDMKYASLRSTETFGATIEAFQSPKEFGLCDGNVAPVDGVVLGQQKRKPFAFVYKTKTEKEDAYKIHLIYNCMASPSEKNYETVNDSPDAITFSWEVSTTPIKMAGMKPTATIRIEPDKYRANPKYQVKLEEDDAIREPIKVLEAILFGTVNSAPFLPSPDFVNRILNGNRPIGLRKVPLINDAVLLDISVEGATIDRPFNPNKTEYAFYYDETYMTRGNINLVKYKNDTEIGQAANSARSITGEDLTNGYLIGVTSAGTDTWFSINLSSNVCLMSIKAKNGNDEITYKIYLIPNKQINTMLTSISFGNISFSGFNPLQFSYVNPNTQSPKEFCYHPMTAYYDPTHVTNTGTVKFGRKVPGVNVSGKWYDETTSSNTNKSGTTGDMPGTNLNGHTWRLMFNSAFSGSQASIYFIRLVPVEPEEPVEPETPIEVETNG